jgi:hypothetical protein
MQFRIGILLLVTALAAPALAQPAGSQWPDLPPPETKAKPKAKAKQPPPSDVEELTPAQIKRAQDREQPPGGAKDAPQAVKRAPKGGGGAQPRQIACNGPFAKDSSHIRLAQVFGAQNVEFTEVDGPDNSKLMASVLFPKDPKRRLEVLWENNATRTSTQLIVINGQSAWSAPQGLRLGLQIAALEKLNRKPFKLTGFGADGSTVADWQGGALASLPGGCKLGLRLVMDQRAPEEARTKLADAKELLSSDAGVRAVRASIAEILLGY